MFFSVRQRGLKVDYKGLKKVLFDPEYLFFLRKILFADKSFAGY